MKTPFHRFSGQKTCILPSIQHGGAGRCRFTPRSRTEISTCRIIDSSPNGRYITDATRRGPFRTFPGFPGLCGFPRRGSFRLLFHACADPPFHGRTSDEAKLRPPNLLTFQSGKSLPKIAILQILPNRHFQNHSVYIPYRRFLTWTIINKKVFFIFFFARVSSRLLYFIIRKGVSQAKNSRFWHFF